MSPDKKRPQKEHGREMEFIIIALKLRDFLRGDDDLDRDLVALSGLKREDLTASHA